MAGSGAGAKSLKEYLKRYESSNPEEDEKKKKKKKKMKNKETKASSVLVVDQDPIWQKPVKLDEEEDNDSPDEEKPIVDEDIDVKRMRRLELLRSRRPYNAIAEDGSGWVTLSPKHKTDVEPSLDMSPPRRGRARNDTPSPEPKRKHLWPSLDMSPPRRGRTRNDSPSLEPDRKHLGPSLDVSPPRRGRTRNDSPSPEPDRKHLRSGGMDVDLSPPRQRRLRQHTPSLETGGGYARDESADMSPPRRRHRSSPDQDEAHALPGTDLSLPRKSRRVVERSGLDGLSPPRLARHSIEKGGSRASFDQDISPPRKNRKEATVLASSNERPKIGLISGRDMREEIVRTKKNDLLRFEQMDPSMSGRGAEAVYRDKKGNRISKDEYMKLNQKVEEKPKEKKIEWGKGLAQKREAEASLLELESEKDKPFARTRDDPELDEMLKERVRWGDPMAHLVKKKHSEAILPNLGENEKMKESGFIIPQDIPSHSWIKRGLDAAPNRYGIKPGRHWDGVDRSNGFEKQFFKRMNEKQATEREAYLWSVSDM